jgi:hypothetical protein
VAAGKKNKREEKKEKKIVQWQVGPITSFFLPNVHVISEAEWTSFPRRRSATETKRISSSQIHAPWNLIY